MKREVATLNSKRKFGHKHGGLAAGLALIIVLVTLNSFLELDEKRLLKSVQKGDADLHCLFPDGVRKVDKALVIGLEEGEWKFKNGYASSCWVVNHKLQTR